MASIKTKLTVGIFVIIGFAIAFVAVIWLGMSSQFEKGQFYAAYFDESVQGLSKDSPVKYRGVAVGRVDTIRVAPDATLIEVVLKIETDLKPGDGMVAQLKSVGITGIMFVELDRRAEDEPDRSPKLPFEPKFPVVATKPSEISRIIGRFDEVLNQIVAMDLGGISRRVKTLLSRVDGSVADMELGRLSSEIQKALNRWSDSLAAVEQAGKDLSRLTRDTGKAVNRIETVFTGVDNLVDDSRGDIAALLAEVRQMVGAADTILAEGTDLVKTGRHLLQNQDTRIADVEDNLVRTLADLNQAARAMNRLMEEISAHPSRILFGAPPTPRIHEGEDQP